MKKILLLQGGFNEEHKVSLNTAKEVAKVLKKLNIKFKILTVNPSTFKKDLLKYSNNFIAFNALHGTFGEDGNIQRILKNNKFCFTHSDEISSDNCFDKFKSKRIIKKSKIITPAFEIIKCEKINSSFLNSVKKNFLNL